METSNKIYYTIEDIHNYSNELVTSKTFSPEFILYESMDKDLVLEQPSISEPDVDLSSFKTPMLLGSMEKTPKLIFIIPYRDREQQKTFFLNHMKMVLSDMEPSDYKVYFAEQCDSRDFNRGAMKNIGFLVMKKKYPADYQNITFVFNDIDTMPYTKNFFDYQTYTGIVKHFFGYTFALGGIVSITGRDFERISGYPNFWAWGYEDNMLQKRVLAANIKIDRSQFYNIMDKNVIQLKDGLLRSVNRNEFDRYVANTNEGIQSIENLQVEINEECGIIRITSFSTGIDNTPDKNIDFDMRNGNKPFSVNKSSAGNRNRPKMGMIIQ